MASRWVDGITKPSAPTMSASKPRTSAGRSFGLRLAARRPRLLRSLTLIGCRDADAADITTSYKMIPLLVRTLGTNAIAGGFMKQMFSPAFLDDPGRRNEVLELKRRFGRNRRAGVARAAQSVIRLRALGDELDAIRVP